MTTFDDLFKNIEGKEGNAGNRHFLLFQQCFLHYGKKIQSFAPNSFCCLQILSICTKLKLLSSGKGLIDWNIVPESLPWQNTALCHLLVISRRKLTEQVLNGCFKKRQFLFSKDSSISIKLHSCGTWL